MDFDRVDDFGNHAPKALRPDGAKIDVGRVQRPVFGDLPGTGMNRLGDGFRSGTTVGHVVLDPEIPVPAAGIVARRQDQSTIRLQVPDDCGGSGRGQQTFPAHHDTPCAVGRRHPEDPLDRLGIEEPAVAPKDQGPSRQRSDRVEHRLHVVFEIALPHVGACPCPKPGRSGPLAINWGGLDDLQVHLSSHSATFVIPS